MTRSIKAYLSPDDKPRKRKTLKRNYSKRPEDAQAEVAAYAALYPWYGRLVGAVRDTLNHLDATKVHEFSVKL